LRAVANVSGMNDDGQDEAERVDENMPFVASDLLARIIALGIDRGLPYCAALALWPSMIAALALGARPLRSRTVA
jgi:hypothetical protein